MKGFEMKWIVVICVLVLSSVASAADPNWAVGVSSVDTRYEARVGAEWDYLGLYLAPSYNVTSNDVGIRLYGTYSAVDADMVANLLGTERQLPEGNLYGGVFGGWRFRGEQMEAGLLIGGRVQIASKLESFTEWQYHFTGFADDFQDRWDWMTGLHFWLN